jgi:5-methylcytosine-specific restriction endonuclease McrA
MSVRRGPTLPLSRTDGAPGEGRARQTASQTHVPLLPVRRGRPERASRLKRLGYSSYAEYLRSPHWQRTRHAYRQSDQPQDCICGETDHLQLHHMTYERVGAEEMADLTPLCGRCHAMIHTLEARGEIGLDFAGFVNDQRAKLYAQRNAAHNERAARAAATRAQEQDRLLARSMAARLKRAQRTAAARGIDITAELHAFDAILDEWQAKLDNAA